MRQKFLLGPVLLFVLIPSVALHAEPWVTQPLSVQVASGTASGSVGPSAVMTPSGDFIMLETSGNNLVVGVTDANGQGDISLHDRQANAHALPVRSGSDSSRTPNGNSIPRAVSADGRWVLFDSSANDTAAGMVETGWFGPDSDVFLHDRQTGTTQLVSHRSDSIVHTGSAESNAVALSDDGRWVLYTSHASDLVAGVSGYSGRGVFLFDRLSNSTRLVTRDFVSSSVAANATSRATGMSEDGRWILLGSEASNLVAGFVSGNGGQENVYLYDRDAQSMVLVSHVSASAVTGGNHRAEPVALTPDGRWVLFDSFASDLVGAVVDDNFSSDVFRYDRLSAQVMLVSHAAGSTGQVANEASTGHAISNDGARVLLASSATNLMAGVTDANAAQDVFLRDLPLGATSLVSHSSSVSVAANGLSAPAGMSADGSQVLFTSEADNVAGMTLDGNGAEPDLFRFESATGVVRLVGHQAAMPTVSPGAGAGALAMDASGRWVTYRTRAVNVLTGLADQNDAFDAFLKDMTTGDTRLLAPAAPMGTQTGNRESMGQGLSANGRWALIRSRATNLVADVRDNNEDMDVFVIDRRLGSTHLISHVAGSPTVAGDASSWPAGMSGDGRWVLFESSASNLAAGVADNNGQTDVYLRDRQSDSAILVSRVAGQLATPATSSSHGAGLSEDARWVLYRSAAADLVSGMVDSLGHEDVFLFDRISGQSQLVSHAAGSALDAANGESFPIGLSADGRYVAYSSRATNLVAGLVDSNGTDDVFLFDRNSGSSVLVSRAAGVATPTTANSGSLGLGLSRNSPRVLFSSGATNLVDGVADLNGQPDLFLFDADAGSVRLISRSANVPGQTAAGASLGGVMDASGARVLWQSNASDVVTGVVDANAADDIFLYDYAGNTSTLVSHSASDPTHAANGESTGGFISRSGDAIGFSSLATDLVAGVADANQTEDVILHRVAAGSTHLLSRSAYAAGSTANGYTAFAGMDHDGRHVLLTSEASDLATPLYDVNGALDVFIAVDQLMIFADGLEE